MRYSGDTSRAAEEDESRSPGRRERAVEWRFLVTEEHAEEILAWSRRMLVPDPHGGGPHGDAYRVTTLRFDTPTLDVHRRSGSYGRAKYRIRRYDQATEVFLERKLRTQDMLVKWRSSLTLSRLSSLVNGAGRSADTSCWFSRRIVARRLGPVCQISYMRAARQCAAAGSVARLTVDSTVEAWPLDALSFIDGGGTRVASGHAVVELKFTAAAPAAFKALVEQFRLTPATLSKYRLAMAGLGLAPRSEPRQADGEDQA